GKVPCYSLSESIRGRDFTVAFHGSGAAHATASDPAECRGPLRALLASSRLVRPFAMANCKPGPRRSRKSHGHPIPTRGDLPSKAKDPPNPRVLRQANPVALLGQGDVYLRYRRSQKFFYN